MNIAVYANEIAEKGSSGVRVYSLAILRYLLRQDQKNRYFLYSKRDISGFFCCGNKVFSILKNRKFWAFTAFAEHISKDKPDVLFMPIQIYPFWKKNSIKTVVVVHDVAFLLFPRHFTFFKCKLLKFHTKRAIMFSDHIIVPSNATKKDILRFYEVNPSKISVVYHGFNRNLLKTARKDDSRVLELTKGAPYALFVGSLQPRKNIDHLIGAFEKLKNNQKELKLVLCGGKGWMSEGILSRISQSSQKADIILAGDVSDDLLSSFYKNALFFVFPSLYEGFGLPVLEAMSFGLPVVCAKNSSISEIAGDAALYFDEYRISDMAEKMLILCENGALQAEFSQKSLKQAEKFSWERSARETLEVLEKV